MLIYIFIFKPNFLFVKVLFFNKARDKINSHEFKDIMKYFNSMLYIIPYSHLLNFWWKSQGNVREIHKNCHCQGKFKCFVNILESADITRFISMFRQRIRVINVIFCYTADKFESGKKISNQGKVRENKNIKIMATMPDFHVNLTNIKSSLTHLCHVECTPADSCSDVKNLLSGLQV